MRCNKIVLVTLTALLLRAFNLYCFAALSHFVRLPLYILKTHFVLFFYCVLTKWRGGRRRAVCPVRTTTQLTPRFTRRTLTIFEYVDYKYV